ncbi:MAG: motility protein A, partial [Acetatifactor sp.]|nr:motility protein A [Acetatifactor sp.]
MDIASLIGFIMCFVMLVYGIISNHADIMTYLNFPSAVITFGGALFAIMLSYSMSDFLNGLKSIRLIFKKSPINTAEMIKSIIDLSNVARKEGLLSLEEAAADLNEPFLKKGILLIVDGT